jgi:RNA polymerase sigma factor (sigma-70 family)
MTSLQRKECITSQTPAGFPDSVLVRQALTGDERAFESLVERYHNPLLSYIYSYLQDREQASDVVQFVFLQLFVTLPTLMLNTPVKAWLYTVARNRSLDELRKRRSSRLTVHFSELEQEYSGEMLSLLENIIDPHPLPEEIVERLDIRGPLQRALSTLSSTNRLIVMLHSVGQLSFSEIARKLMLPEFSVKTRYYRALPKLRASLKHDQEFLA